MNAKSTGILLCGGIGQRMEANIPKQFLEVQGIPVVIWTMRKMDDVECIQQFVAVVHEAWMQTLEEMIRKYGIQKCRKVVPGGKTRLDSIFNGLNCLEGVLDETEIVTIHDGVRPMVNAEILEDSIRIALQYDAALAGDRCYDTMYTTDDLQAVSGVALRDKLIKGQTPESCQLGKAIYAIKKSQKEMKGDIPISTAMMNAGWRVGLSKGSSKNIKLTTTDDLQLFEALLEREKRNGFDGYAGK